MNGSWAGDSVSVTVDWARYGKNPGDHEGYRVLACSEGPVSFAGFREATGRFDLGTPEELPQVAVSYLAPVGQRDRNYLALSIVEHKDGHRDATGRPIAYTRYFCAPYKDLSAGRVGYQALYQAFQGIDLPFTMGMQFLVHVPGMPLPVQSGDGLAARVAALLLTGRSVCVLGAGQLGVADRLRFVDGVMSLLPYGMRAKMSAATWTRSTSQHRFRLFFSDSPRAALDGRDEDLVAVWDRPDQTEIPRQYPHALEYLYWLDGAMRAPAEGLADFTEESGFGAASVLKMLEKVGVNVPGRDQPGKAGPPGWPPAPAGPSRPDHATQVLLSINDRVSTGNLRGLRADIVMLSSMVKKAEESREPLPASVRRRYREVIVSNQLFRPELQARLGKESEEYNRVLLRLAFGLPLGYQGYCQLEDLLGTGSPPDPPPPAPLLDAIRRAGMPDIRVAAIVLTYQGEDGLREWFRTAQLSIEEMVGSLAGQWDRVSHAKIVCSAILWYLRTMRDKVNPAEVRAVFARHDYLAPALQARHADEPQYQVEMLQAFLVAALGTKAFGNGIVTGVLRGGAHQPTWALLCAVLLLLDPADPDLPGLAMESFFRGMIGKSGFSPDVEARLLRYVSPGSATDPGPAGRKWMSQPAGPSGVSSALRGSLCQRGDMGGGRYLL